jgi:hypothetical protein
MAVDGNASPPSQNRYSLCMILRRSVKKTPDAVGGISIQKLNIACQLEMVETNKKMFLFDLQAVSFWVQKILTSGF